MVAPRLVNPPGLGPPVGFSHGVRDGDTLYVAGQIGARAEGRDLTLVSTDFTAQFEKALENVLEVVLHAGGQPQGLVEMTIFVTDLEAYRAARGPIGQAWKRLLGRHYPAVTLVEVTGLLEPGALVEIRAVASLE